MNINKAFNIESPLTYLDERSTKEKENDKVMFLLDYLSTKNETKALNNTKLVDYFNKYQAFCFDLCLDSVLKGDLNFTYK